MRMLCTNSGNEFWTHSNSMAMVFQLILIFILFGF